MKATFRLPREAVPVSDPSSTVPWNTASPSSPVSSRAEPPAVPLSHATSAAPSVTWAMALVARTTTAIVKRPSSLVPT
ncbi:hypothetical protein ACK8N7_32925 [Streptomyces griseobrunneus]